MVEAQSIKRTIIVDGEFLEVMDKLRDKIKSLAYDGVTHISSQDLTRIIARKIKESKLI